MNRSAKLLSFIVVVAALSIGTLAADLLGGPVFINEIAWAGASWRSTAEWIELCNASSEPVDLDGWRLVSSDGSPDITLHGIVSPRVAQDPSSGFFLLERDDDSSVPGIVADQIYSGALTNRGEALFLYDPDEQLVDTANASQQSASSWPAGGGDVHDLPTYASMERLDYRLPDVPDNWTSSTAAQFDESGRQPVIGTPRHENSVFNILPVAMLELLPQRPEPGESIAFDASASVDENDIIISYQWDFGDGHTGSGATVSHAYELPGTYVIQLTLADAKGGEAQQTLAITVQTVVPPLADFSVVVLTPSHPPRAGVPLRFQDESSDVDGEIVQRKWQFGDGAVSSDADVIHTYDRGGTYVASLWIADNHGEEALQTQSITVASQFPIAALERSPDRPNTGDLVRFDASSSEDPDGCIVRYRWMLDSAEECIRTDSVFEHVFHDGGEHTIRLIVIDDAGESSAPITQTIWVNRTPSAGFGLSTFESNELDPVCFNDLSHDDDGSIVAWQWRFGDGSSSTETSPTHAYERDGTFTVALTVTDTCGATDTTTAEITIHNLSPIAQLATSHLTQPTDTSFAFDASGSLDPSPTGSIAQYEWDLDGDGTYEAHSTVPTASQSYDDDGTYCVSVRVTDDDGAVAVSDPVSVTSTNRAPRISHMTWTPTAPTDETQLQFSATANDPDGQIVRWEWKFGDQATETKASPEIQFLEDGRHTVRLTVWDDDGAASDPYAIDVIIANAPPVAVLTTAILDGRCVSFHARNSYDPSPNGEILHVAWDFGDATSCPGTPTGCGSGNRLEPTHCYPAPGTYAVTLVVIDDQGASSRTTQSIHIAE